MLPFLCATVKLRGSGPSILNTTEACETMPVPRTVRIPKATMETAEALPIGVEGGWRFFGALRRRRETNSHRVGWFMFFFRILVQAPSTFYCWVVVEMVLELLPVPECQPSVFCDIFSRGFRNRPAFATVTGRGPHPNHIVWLRDPSFL